MRSRSARRAGRSSRIAISALLAAGAIGLLALFLLAAVFAPPVMEARRWIERYLKRGRPVILAMMERQSMITGKIGGLEPCRQPKARKKEPAQGALSSSAASSST